MPTITWKTEKRKVKDLKPFPGNPRKITRSAIEKVKDRIKKRGFHDVLKIDTEDTILSGHIRTEALKELGIEEVDVKVPDRKLTKAERDAVVLESNRNDGEWDEGLLGKFDQETLLEVGFESSEVDVILEEDEDEEDPFDGEKVAENIKKPTTKRGDMFKLGDHLLLCGDSTDPKDIEKLMGGVKADMLFTDPPYNMNYKSRGKLGKIENDNMGSEEFLKFTDGFVKNIVEFTKPTAPLYICSNFTIYPTFLKALNFNNIKVGSMIIWVKNNFVLSGKDYHGKYEMISKAKKVEPKKEKAQPILYAWQEGNEHLYLEDRTQSDVWEITKRSASTMSHPTQKPIALINKAIKNSSERGGLVLDLFGGSGSTLISAQKTGRQARLIELDPKFCDVIIQRYESLTFDKAQKL
ncbi:MAG: DNA modification methylase [Patescibacteria group bacterium]